MAARELWFSVAVAFCLLTRVAVADADCGRLLLIVGSVDQSSARVLFAAPSHEQVTLSLVLDGISDRAIIVGEEPIAVVYSDLESNAEHSLNASWNGGLCSVDAHFQTTPPLGRKDTSVAVVSCNRYVEDRDSTMWDRLSAEVQQGRVDVTVHLGDQVYADWIAREQEAEEGYCATLTRFRDYYRISWGHEAAETVLRGTANYMLPDDHEVANNFAAAMWDPSFFSDSVAAATSTDQERRWQLLVRAGVQAFYEYQAQLAHDCDDWIEAVRAAGDCAGAGDGGTVQDLAALDRLLLSSDRPRLYHRMDFQHNRVLFVDTRMERTLSFEEDHPLLGEEQLEWTISQVREAYGDNDVKRLVLFSSVPILFQSPIMAEIAWVFEGEKYPSHTSMHQDTIPLLSALLDHQHHTKCLAIAGDLHMYYEGTVCASSGECIDSLVTSGLTKRSTALDSLHLFLYNWVCFFLPTGSVVGPLASYTPYFNEVFLHNNFLLLHANSDGVSWTPFVADLNRSQQIRHTLCFATPLFAKAAVTLASLILLLPLLKL